MRCIWNTLSVEPPLITQRRLTICADTECDARTPCSMLRHRLHQNGRCPTGGEGGVVSIACTTAVGAMDALVVEVVCGKAGYVEADILGCGVKIPGGSCASVAGGCPLLKV